MSIRLLPSALDPDTSLRNSPRCERAAPSDTARVPYDVSADRIVIDGDSYFRAMGAVEIRRETMQAFGDSIEYCDTNYDALDGADALVILTEWQPYRVPDFERIRLALKEPVVFDGRNLYDPKRMAEHGIEYHSIGRPAIDRRQKASAKA